MPYHAAGITPQMEEFNKAMSSVRISVEWLFGDIINYFKFVDFKKTQKISVVCPEWIDEFYSCIQIDSGVT